MTTYIDSDAWISHDGLYRYWLSRRIGNGPRTIAFVGLNPSTADASRDDPTIRRCVGFARLWEFDLLYMANLYAWRCTNPKKLPEDSRKAIGPQNEAALSSVACWSEIVVLCWGAYRLHEDAKMLAAQLADLSHARCFGTTKAGKPRHPLYLSKESGLCRVGELNI